MLKKSSWFLRDRTLYCFCNVFLLSSNMETKGRIAKIWLSIKKKIKIKASLLKPLCLLLN